MWFPKILREWLPSRRGLHSRPRRDGKRQARLSLEALEDRLAPSVTIVANDPSASETTAPAAADPGQFTVTRTDDPTNPLTVNYTVGGTATNGADFNLLTGTVVIGAGQNSATIDVTPMDDALTEGAETAIVTLLPGAYTIASPTSATVTIADNELNINIVKLTNGIDNNTPPGAIVPVGSAVTFTYNVTNTGLNPLQNVVVTDDNGTPGNAADDFNATFAGGDTNGNGLLETGETWKFAAERVATPGQYTNSATATGSDTVLPIAVSDSDVDNHFGNNPLINVVKLTNGADNDSAPGPVVPAGSTVTFTYVVTNPGNVPLSGVVVRDDNGTSGNAADDFNATFVGGDANSDGLLDTTETWTFTASRIATAGQYTNLATASATDVNLGATASDTNSDNHFGAAPAINIVKLTNGADNDTPRGPTVPAGTLVTFTYIVTNTGNVSLSNVTVRDDNGTAANPADDFNAIFLGGDTIANGLLDPSETWTFTAGRIATPGQHANVATARGTPPPGAGPAAADTNRDHHFGLVDIIATARDAGGSSHVNVFNTDGSLRFRVTAYPGFLGGVHVATGDVNGDGVEDLITAPGRGMASLVKVFDGRSGVLMAGPVGTFLAYNQRFLGGAFVAAGDVNADGKADIITGAGAGAGPHVKVFSGADGALLANFFAYQKNYRDGVRVASGDVDGDSRADIITATARARGFIKVFSGAPGNVPLRAFPAFNKPSRGAFVAAGDVNGDQRAEIFAGAGVGRRVRVFDGLTAAAIQDFNAYGAGFAGGVRVGAVDRDGDGRADLLAAPGPRRRPLVRVFSVLPLALIDAFFAFDPQFRGGVFVG